MDKFPHGTGTDSMFYLQSSHDSDFGKGSESSSPHPLAKSSKEVFNKLHNVQKRDESYSYKRSMKYVTPLDTWNSRGLYC